MRMLELGEGETCWRPLTRRRHDEYAAHMVILNGKATTILGRNISGGCQINRESLVCSQAHKPRERCRQEIADDLQHLSQ